MSSTSGGKGKPHQRANSGPQNPFGPGKKPPPTTPARTRTQSVGTPASNGKTGQSSNGIKSQAPSGNAKKPAPKPPPGPNNKTTTTGKKEYGSGNNNTKKTTAPEKSKGTATIPPKNNPAKSSNPPKKSSMGSALPDVPPGDKNSSGQKTEPAEVTGESVTEKNTQEKVTENKDSDKGGSTSTTEELSQKKEAEGQNNQKDNTVDEGSNKENVDTNKDESKPNTSNTTDDKSNTSSSDKNNPSESKLTTPIINVKDTSIGAAVLVAGDIAEVVAGEHPPNQESRSRSRSEEKPVESTTKSESQNSKANDGASSQSSSAKGSESKTPEEKGSGPDKDKQQKGESTGDEKTLNTPHKTTSSSWESEKVESAKKKALAYVNAKAMADPKFKEAETKRQSSDAKDAPNSTKDATNSTKDSANKQTSNDSKPSTPPNKKNSQDAKKTATADPSKDKSTGKTATVSSRSSTGSVKPDGSKGTTNSNNKNNNDQSKQTPNGSPSGHKGGEGSKKGSNGDGHGHGGGGGAKVLMLAQRGEWNLMDQLLKTGPDVTAVEKDSARHVRLVQDLKNNMEELLCATIPETGVTALMIAVRENRLVIAERLIELGCEVNYQAKDGRTALHFAAAHARDDIVKQLIIRRADANITGGPKDQLPLHYACSRPSGVITTVQVLLRAMGKDGRIAADKDGTIPIFLAAEAGNTSVCRELLTSHTDQQIQAKRKSHGDTLLHVACRRKDLEMAKLFVETGAVIDAQNKDGQTALHISAHEGDDTMVKYFHQLKANVNITDKHDCSPLHIAAEKGHTNIVDILVDKFRANVFARTKDGSTLMHIASQYGHPETAMAFLKKGVPLLMPNKSGAICLHAAAMKGHTSVIRALLQKGAPVDARTKDNLTAVHIAVEWGRPQVVQTFLGLGASVDVRGGEHNFTALHVAVERCKPQVIQTLLGYGAQVQLKGGESQETPLHIAARVKDGEKCAEMLLKSGADVNSTKENGETALHIAARYGQLKMVAALLAEGANSSWLSKAGETPLHIAVRYCHWEVAEEMLRFINKHRSRIDAVMLVNQQNNEGETALHYAAELTKAHSHHEFEDTDIIKLLLEYDGDCNVHTRLTQETGLHYCARAGNADIMLEIVKHIGPTKVQVAVNKQAKNGWSPLLVASEHGHLEILKILMENHARVDVFDEHGKAALHLAAANGHDEVADALLKQRAFANAKSKLGLAPLHLSAQNGFNTLVKLLVETHGATIDALSLAKKTPLHMAAQNGQIEVCSTLLKMKADASATDVQGQTPLHLAAENDHSDVVKLFLKYRPELVTMANTNGMTCAHIAASKGSVAVIKELMRFNKVVITTARNKTHDSTTLHLAAAGGHTEVVKVLLEAGASATDENADGMTAIHLAAKFGHTQLLEVLKDHVSWKVTSTKTGYTALHVAAHCGQIDFVREMLGKVPATLRSEPPHSGADGGLRDMPTESGLTPLHMAAQSGHEGLVRLLLNSPGVQVDVGTSVHGVIPLHMAAQYGHTAVVSLLLSKSTSQLHVKDKRGRTSLHLAASHGHLNMVSLLLGQGADINIYDKNGWTPLHFASKAGHLDVVKLLMETGAGADYETKDGKIALCYAATANHTSVLSYLLTKEHSSEILMEDNKFVFDLMVVGKSNQNKSIQEFILVSPAPVDTAVKMSKAFRTLAIKEKERAKDLLNAGDFCEAMATELNAIAANMSNAGVLLKALDSRGMPFLDILIECEAKEVVAHPSVQKYLSEVWVGTLTNWSSWKMLMLFCVLLLIPPVWLAFSLPIKHKFNKVPVIKLMSYLVSHIYLIALYGMTVVPPFYTISQSYNLIPHWYEWLLLAWMSGLLVSQLTNPEDRQGLGWIKVIIIAISAVGVFVHILGFAFEGDDRLNCIYIRNQFFAFALLLCFVQLLDFLSFHHLFGPWAIIIRDLMKDLTRFLVILCIFMIGFTLNMAAIYVPVRAEVGIDEKKGDGVGAGGAAIESPFDTFEMLFFALFGLVEPESLPPLHRNPVWSLVLAKAVFGIYLIITSIVLINLLIAMMSDTYQRIQAQSDTEWKFGRAKLFRNMNKTSATPSPMNMFTKLFVYFRVLCKHKGKACSMDAQRFIDEEEDLDSDTHGFDMMNSQGQAAWVRSMVRRSTQVAPEDGFMGGMSRTGPVLLENVVVWKKVADQYLHMQGQGEGSTVEIDTDHIEDINTTVEELSEKPLKDPAAIT